jgi:hypothetical protein
MLKKLFSLIPVFFILAFSNIMIGSVLKIMHIGNMDYLLAIGLVFSIIFMVLSIYEVLNSNRIKKSEKLMWTIALLFLNTLAGFLYILVGRRKVI